MKIKDQLFAAAAAAALFAAPAAFAQDASAEAGMTAQTPAGAAAGTATSGASAFSDTQVSGFASAMNDVQSLNDEYAPRLASESDAAAKAELQREMNTKMTAAVESSGITAQEYNQIAAAAQTDAGLRTRIGQAMQADAAGGADASATAPTTDDDAMEPSPEAEMDAGATAETPAAEPQI